MPDLLRAQVTFEHQSALPKDRVSNNFWFLASDGADAAAAENVAERVHAAYTAVVSPLTHRPAQWLSPAIKDLVHTVKVYEYDMATGDRLTFPEGPPLHTLAFGISAVDVGARSGSDPLPAEVALCVTYKANFGAVPGGGNFMDPPARRRGRFYFGPLTTEAQDPGAAGRSVPTPPLINELLEGFGGLVGTGLSEQLVVYSRPFAGRAAISAEDRANAGGPFRPLPALPARTGQAYIVDECSIDNAWDTQRRRGEAATARTVY